MDRQIIVDITPKRNRKRKNDNLILLFIKKYWITLLAIIIATLIVTIPYLYWNSLSDFEKLELILNFFEWLRSMNV